VSEPAPKFPLRDLTPEESLRYARYAYVKYEEYPRDGSSVVGRFWTKEQLADHGIVMKPDLKLDRLNRVVEDLRAAGAFKPFQRVTIHGATMNKGQILYDATSCFNRATADEPLFVLRAKDPLFRKTIDHWATMAEATGAHDQKKIDSARAEGEAGERWRAERTVSEQP